MAVRGLGRPHQPSTTSTKHTCTKYFGRLASIHGSIHQNPYIMGGPQSQIAGRAMCDKGQRTGETRVCRRRRCRHLSFSVLYDKSGCRAATVLLFVLCIYGYVCVSYSVDQEWGGRLDRGSPNGRRRKKRTQRSAVATRYSILRTSSSGGGGDHRQKRKGPTEAASASASASASAASTNSFLPLLGFLNGVSEEAAVLGGGTGSFSNRRLPVPECL